VDAWSAVAIAYQDGFQGGRSQLEQQHSYVSALVESVLDIRGPGEVLSATLWTPDVWHSGVDAGRHYDIDGDYHFDHSADPAEACGVSQPRRVSTSSRCAMPEFLELSDIPDFRCRLGYDAGQFRASNVFEEPYASIFKAQVPLS
jgi:hypothetical protein